MLMACFIVNFIKGNVIGENGRCKSVLQRAVKVEAQDQYQALQKARQAARSASLTGMCTPIGSR